MRRALSRALLTLGLAAGGPAPAQDWSPEEKLAFLHCGRCHVIGERNRMGGIGSTPGFAVIRTWPDWEAKMRGFYLLNPHPAFTQIEGVTDPFPADRPSPIHPVRLTEEQLARIIDYARRVAPADLGAPIN